MKAIINGTICTPNEVIEDGVLIIDGATIHAMGNLEALPVPANAEIIDARGKWVTPGLIDIHTYGCLGVALTAPERVATELPALARHVARFGVTRFLVSPMIGDRAFITRMLAMLAAVLPDVRAGALPLGIHLEGPWLDPAQHGAFPLEFLHAPTLSEAREYLDAAGGWLRVVTLAPNLPNAREVAHFLHENGVRVSLGHTNTDYACASEALASGDYALVTHVYNAMSGLHHRNPGVLGAVFSSDRIYGMLICDGIHTHPAAAQILFRALGTDRVILVTDASPGGGMTEGSFTMLNQTATIVDGTARLPDGTLAGSILTLNQAVQNAQKFACLSMSEAVQMASVNPARVLGLWDMGSLNAGADADSVVMDQDGNVSLTMVAGETVYQA